MSEGLKIPGPDVAYDELVAAGAPPAGGNTGERLREPGAGWNNSAIEQAHLKMAHETGEPTDAKPWLDSLKRRREPQPCRLDRGDGQICGTLTLAVITPEVRIVGPRMLGGMEIPVCESCQEKVRAYRLARPVDAPCAAAE